MTSTTDATTDVASRTGVAAEDGTAMLEMAFAFMAFFLVLWGLLSYGMIFAVDHTLASASAEGARAAVATSDEASAIATASSVARAQLDALGANSAAAVVEKPTVDACVAPAGAQCITVSVSYPWRAAPIIPILLPFGVPATITSTSTVQLSS